jgi:hypothetical protein
MKSRSTTVVVVVPAARVRATAVIVLAFRNRLIIASYVAAGRLAGHDSLATSIFAFAAGGTRARGIASLAEFQFFVTAHGGTIRIGKTIACLRAAAVLVDTF